MDSGPPRGRPLGTLPRPSTGPDGETNRWRFHGPSPWRNKLSPDVQSPIGSAQVCDDVESPVVSSTDQVTALLPKLLGIATTDDPPGAPSSGNSPQ